MKSRYTTRHSLAIALAAGCSLELGGALPSRAAEAGAANALRVACVGDSITQGVHVRGEDNYPSVLGRLLGAGYEKIIGSEIIPLIREVAAEKKLPLIDIHAAFEGKPELFADGVHPNAAGCAVLAQAVRKAIVGSLPAPGIPAQRAGAQQRSAIQIRDPFILPVFESNTYFMYRQMSVRLDDGRRRQGVGVYTSQDLQQWQGPKPVFHFPDGFWADQSVWAPEVHRYNGHYYLFATFTAKEKYAVGIACSSSGKVAGPWHQTETPLLANDGGHGMIFKTFDGRLVMAIHQPNQGNIRVRLFELEDVGETLRVRQEIPMERPQ